MTVCWCFDWWQIIPNNYLNAQIKVLLVVILLYCDVPILDLLAFQQPNLNVIGTFTVKENGENFCINPRSAVKLDIQKLLNNSYEIEHNAKVIILTEAHCIKTHAELYGHKAEKYPAILNAVGAVIKALQKASKLQTLSLDDVDPNEIQYSWSDAIELMKL